MINKPLTLLFVLFFLFFFSGSSVVLGDESELKKEFWNNGKKRLEESYKDGKLDGISTYFYEKV